DDVERHLALRNRADLAAKLLDVGAILADDDTRTGGIDRHAAKLGRTLDDDLADRGLHVRLHDEGADAQVFEQQVAVGVALGVPAAVPRPVDLQAQTDGASLVTHYACSSASSRTTTRMRLNGFSMRAERPRAR